MNFAANHKNLQVKSAKNPNSVKEWRQAREKATREVEELTSFLYSQLAKQQELNADNDPEYKRITIPKFNSIFGMEDDWMHSKDWDAGCR